MDKRGAPSLAPGSAYERRALAETTADLSLINPPRVPVVAVEVANPMPLESNAAAIGAVRASCDADHEHERPGVLSGSFSGFGREESAERAAG